MPYELSLSKRQSQSDNWLYGCKRKFVVEILLYYYILLSLIGGWASLRARFHHVLSPKCALAFSVRTHQWIGPQR